MSEDTNTTEIRTNESKSLPDMKAMTQMLFNQLQGLQKQCVDCQDKHEGENSEEDEDYEGDESDDSEDDSEEDDDRRDSFDERLEILRNLTEAHTKLISMFENLCRN